MNLPADVTITRHPVRYSGATRDYCLAVLAGVTPGVGPSAELAVADVLRNWLALQAPSPRPPLHVRIVSGGDLIADLPDWTYPVPRVGEYLFHPPLTPDSSPANVAGHVKVVTWRTHDRSDDPDATAFVQTARPYVEITI